MDSSTLWNIVLTSVSAAIFSVIGFVAKTKFAELDKVATLLSHTREQIARDHITRAEYSRDLEKLGDRFDNAFQRLEAKLDDINRGNTRHG